MDTVDKEWLRGSGCRKKCGLWGGGGGGDREEGGPKGAGSTDSDNAMVNKRRRHWAAHECHSVIYYFDKHKLNLCFLRYVSVARKTSSLKQKWL